MVTQEYIEQIGLMINDSGFSDWISKHMDNPASDYHKLATEFARYLDWTFDKVSCSYDKLGILLHYTYAIRYGQNGELFRPNLHLGRLGNEMLNCIREVAFQLGDRRIKFYLNN